MVSEETSIEQRICAVIVQACQTAERPLVPGTFLGALVRQQFPNVDIKLRFGGLRKFIRTFCTDSIMEHGSVGLDILYVHVDRQRDREVLVTESTGNKLRAWAAFSNPNYAGRLFVNKDTREIMVIGPDQEGQRPFLEVTKVSEAEYREFARRFLTEAEIKLDDDLEAVISKSGFWFPFVNKIRDVKGEDKYHQLLQLRLRFLRELLSSRLAGLDFGHEDVKILVNRIQGPPETSGSRGITETSSPSTTHRIKTPLTARDLAMSAIQKMSEQDLRQLWLPLNAVLDVVRLRE